jgi:hypothetical protein
MKARAAAKVAAGDRAGHEAAVTARQNAKVALAEHRRPLSSLEDRAAAARNAPASPPAYVPLGDLTGMTCGVPQVYLACELHRCARRSGRHDDRPCPFACCT